MVAHSGGPLYRAAQAGAKAWDIRTGRWREPEVDLVGRLVRRGDVAVDLGANLGLYTYHLSRAVGPGGRVHAFEPVPSTFATLRLVVCALRLHNVELAQAGVSDEEGVVPFVVPLQPSGVANTGLAHLSHRSQGLVTAGAHHQVSCRVGRLDDLLPAPGGDLSLLKADIEGAELLALRGAEQALARHHPTLLLEVDGDLMAGFGLRPADLVAHLGSRGYAPFRYEPPGLVPVGPYGGAPAPGSNWCFVHEQRRPGLAAVLAP